MPHKYQITIQPLDEGGVASAASPLTFTVSNHDELLDIVAKTRTKSVVPEDEATEFAIGLKLFSEVMMRHRKTELFEPLWPHFGEFMKRLKGR